MRSEVVFELDIELNHTVHGDCDGSGFEACYPDVGKSRVFGTLAVFSLGLCDHCYNGEEGTNEAVLEDGDPNNLDWVSM